MIEEVYYDLCPKCKKIVFDRCVRDKSKDAELLEVIKHHKKELDEQIKEEE